MQELIALKRIAAEELPLRKLDLGVVEAIELSVPALSVADLSRAISESQDRRRAQRRRPVPRSRMVAALARVNAAFEQYCCRHMQSAFARRLIPSRIEKRMRAIGESGARLGKALRIEEMLGYLYEEAERHAEAVLLHIIAADHKAVLRALA